MKQISPMKPLAAFLCAWAGMAAGFASASQPELTLEKVMENPDWIGAAVKDSYWSADGRAVYYAVKRSGSPIIDLHRVELADRSDQVVEAKAMADADAPAV